MTDDELVVHMRLTAAWKLHLEVFGSDIAALELVISTNTSANCVQTNTCLCVVLSRTYFYIFTMCWMHYFLITYWAVAQTYCVSQCAKYGKSGKLWDSDDCVVSTSYTCSCLICLLDGFLLLILQSSLHLWHLIPIGFGDSACQGVTVAI